MMLTEEYLSARGDKQGMADKIINLLKDEKRLALERSKAKETSLPFTWKNVAAQTDKVYTSYLSAVRSNLLLA
jgi:glycosyltransferase involved in cell wall biosynthesis